MDVGDETTELRFWEGSSAKYIINVTFVKFRNGSRVGCTDQVFKITHKKTGAARTHFCSHCNAADLGEDLIIKGKGVQIEDKFC